MESSFNVSHNRHIAFFEMLDIDELLAEEREIIDEQLMRESEEWEQQRIWEEHDRVFYPGEIGGVALRLMNENET